MAEAQEVTLEARVAHAVQLAVQQRRAELEQLVREHVDVELQALAGEVVAGQLDKAAQLCSSCGLERRLPQRTVCRGCLRVRTRELNAQRRKRRQAGAAANGDGEEPHPAVASVLPDEPVVRVGVAADVLLARVRRMRPARSGPALTAADLEAWLRDTGLANVTTDGLLVPTALGVELGGALDAL